MNIDLDNTAGWYGKGPDGKIIPLPIPQLGPATKNSCEKSTVKKPKHVLLPLNLDSIRKLIEEGDPKPKKSTVSKKLFQPPPNRKTSYTVRPKIQTHQTPQQVAKAKPPKLPTSRISLGRQLLDKQFKIRITKPESPSIDANSSTAEFDDLESLCYSPSPSESDAVKIRNLIAKNKALMREHDKNSEEIEKLVLKLTFEANKENIRHARNKAISPKNNLAGVAYTPRRAQISKKIIDQFALLQTPKF